MSGLVVPVLASCSIIVALTLCSHLDQRSPDYITTSGYFCPRVSWFSNVYLSFSLFSLPSPCSLDDLMHIPLHIPLELPWQHCIKMLIDHKQTYKHTNCRCYCVYNISMWVNGIPGTSSYSKHYSSHMSNQRPQLIDSQWANYKSMSTLCVQGDTSARVCYMSLPTLPGLKESPRQPVWEVVRPSMFVSKYQ